MNGSSPWRKGGGTPRGMPGGGGGGGTPGKPCGGGMPGGKGAPGGNIMGGNMGGGPCIGCGGVSEWSPSTSPSISAPGDGILPLASRPAGKLNICYCNACT